MSDKRRGRTLATTVNELMESKRLEIAILNWENDKLLLKALFTELGLETMTAVKNRMTRIVGKAYGKGWEDPETGVVRGKGLDAFELIPMLRSLTVTDFDNFNVHWSLTPFEQELYIGNAKGTLSKEERDKLFNRVKNRFNSNK